MAPRATKRLQKPNLLHSAFSLTASITAKTSRSFTAFSQLANELRQARPIASWLPSFASVGQSSGSLDLIGFCSAAIGQILFSLSTTRKRSGRECSPESRNAQDSDPQIFNLRQNPRQGIGVNAPP